MYLETVKNNENNFFTMENQSVTVTVIEIIVHPCQSCQCRRRRGQPEISNLS